MIRQRQPTERPQHELANPAIKKPAHRARSAAMLCLLPAKIRLLLRRDSEDRQPNQPVDFTASN